ncbi:Response regulator PleD [Lacunisphaera limnophila]|uniref:Response regulator PleD n=1 Tax=Lacunisphaera limnophila TaxID=1838286 RepID=A0A1D8AUC4_9BACT|nr:DNA-binding response regulator [Lacunisphaera limnophila]AOS44499.1 Response regulator PleD [Lacunisphaera limnophila]
MSQPSTVLVVDDTPANLGLVLESLGAAGLRVLVAESGARALELLAQQPVDLVLLDMIMPGLDGLAVCQRMKQHPVWRDLPLIFLTAVDDPAQKVRALEAGAVDYLNKPVHPPEVLARVRTHLDLQAARLALQRKNTQLEAEIALRLDAESQLAQSLDRALLIADREGRLVFQTHRATHLLFKHLAHHQPGRLPPELVRVERYQSPAGTLLLHRFMEQGNDALTVLYLIEEHAPPGPAELTKLGITPRQAEVLYWIAQGKTNAEIAIILGTSPRTVEKHVEQLLERLGVENRVGAAAQASELLRRLPG